MRAGKLTKSNSTQIVIKRRRRSFLRSSPAIDGVAAILKSLRRGEITFSQLFIDSNIKFKKSFLKYLNYCKDKQYVTKKPGFSKTPNRWEGRPVMYYSITERGWRFLEVIK